MSYHQHTTGNTSTQFLESARITQKLDQLLHVFLGFVHARHISKRSNNLILTEQLGLTLAEAHGAATPTTTALHLPHKKHEDRNDNQDGETCDQQLRPDALLLGLATLDLDIMLEQIIN